MKTRFISKIDVNRLKNEIDKQLKQTKKNDLSYNDNLRNNQNYILSNKMKLDYFISYFYVYIIFYCNLYAN